MTERYWRYRIPNVPRYAWYVAGRKRFALKHSEAVRRMWGLGHYPIQR